MNANPIEQLRGRGKGCDKKNYLKGTGRVNKFRKRRLALSARNAMERKGKSACQAKRKGKVICKGSEFLLLGGKPSQAADGRVKRTKKNFQIRLGNHQRKRPSMGGEF